MVKTTLKIGFWAVACAAVFTSPLWAAQLYRAMPSTGDISVTANATSAIGLGRGVRWIYIKNDCASDIYLDLRGGSKTDLGVYALRLKGGEVFQAQIGPRTIGVSPADSGAACTLTIIPAR